MIFLKSEYKILKLIYENPGIRLNELMKKARVSAATAKKRLFHLLNSRIVTEEKIIGGKRTILKNFFPNLESEEGKSVFSLVESEKKQEFFKKNKNLTGPFQQLIKNADRKIKIILIFGSFATYSQTRESDLDILFLTKNKIDRNQLKKEIERSFITFEQEVSPRIDTLTAFKKNASKGIYQTIIRNHIIIRGARDFISLLKTKN